MKIVKIADCPEYVAEDKAVAKEFMSPRSTGLQNMSIAEITIPPHTDVVPHYHKACEEVYQIVAGQGEMFLDGARQTMSVGEAVAILPGQWHSIGNPFDEPLKMIVTCSPPWSPEDQIFA